MNLDWQRLRAVVLESDDWGLCAWTPDEQALRVLADTPAFRSPAGRRYAGSTLESAADVKALTATLLEFRGADGFAPVWQANTIVGTPDYSRLHPPLFDVPELPVLEAPDVPARWVRPGLWEEVARARAAGVWWPELHGLHHLPEQAWLTALRRGNPDARRAHEQQSPVCLAVENSGEFAAEEPAELRTRRIGQAVERFRVLFGRPPESFCPPDYRWDERLEHDLRRLGVPTLQGKAEQHGVRFHRLHRELQRHRWRHQAGPLFYMPPRTAFEPRPASGAEADDIVRAAHRGARRSWQLNQPAAISTHRVNYAHLHEAWSGAGRSALRDLLRLFAEDGAVFLTDSEVHQLRDRNWSLRDLGAGGALVRYHGVPREPVRFAAPAAARGVAIAESNAGGGDLRFEAGEVEARLDVGSHRVEWRIA